MHAASCDRVMLVFSLKQFLEELALLKIWGISFFVIFCCCDCGGVLLFCWGFWDLKENPKQVILYSKISPLECVFDDFLRGKKFGQVLLLSTLPTYPKSLDIFEFRFVLKRIFSYFCKDTIALVTNHARYHQGHL